jgi:hypothetical protein
MDGLYEEPQGGRVGLAVVHASEATRSDGLVNPKR